MQIARLNIFGSLWSVVIEKIDSAYAGLCNFNTRQISINHDIAESEMRKITLFHEYLHAHFHRMSYRQSGLSHDLEEVMIDQLAVGLVENLPELMKAIKKLEKK